MKRPDWGPNQVKQTREIIPGHIYVMVNLGGTQEIVALTAVSGAGDETGFMFAYMKSLNSASPLNCQDVNILPYSSGFWNTKNYITRTGKKMKREQLKELLQQFNL